MDQGNTPLNMASDMVDNAANAVQSTIGIPAPSSGGIIGKIGFLLVVLFGFIVLLHVGIQLVSWFVSPTKSPILIDGMSPGNKMMIFQQDPSLSGSKTIYRSVNASDGIEFTWSVWLQITDLTSNGRQYRHIFSKGNSDIGQDGRVYPVNSPGLYIAPDTNALTVVMDTYNTIGQEIDIPDIPLNKWFNIIIRCENTTFDVYVNGVLTRSITLMGVPFQNYGPVNVCMNGGFSGYISSLRYYNYALGITDIQTLVNKGPNVKTVVDVNVNDTNADYLSIRWYSIGGV